MSVDKVYFEKGDLKIVMHGAGVYALEKWPSAPMTAEEKLDLLEGSGKFDKDFLDLVRSAIVGKQKQQLNLPFS